MKDKFIFWFLLVGIGLISFCLVMVGVTVMIIKKDIMPIVSVIIALPLIKSFLKGISFIRELRR